jgi:hypothetical protein
MYNYNKMYIEPETHIAASAQTLYFQHILFM